MAQPMGKKRRINEAARVLSRPFRSPLKTSQTSLSNDETLFPRSLPEDVALQCGNESKFNEHKSLAVGEQPVFESKNQFSPDLEARAVRNSFVSHQAKSVEAITRIEPSLSRQNAVLERQIKNLRSEIDIMTQASKILRSGRDDELECLIIKWKGVSREAAEELFAGVKDRVDRIGGVAAWREKEKETAERLREWNTQAEDIIEKQVVQDEDEEREAAKEDIDKWREEQAEEMKLSKYESPEYDHETIPQNDKVGMSQSAQVDGDESFTMDMMLRSVNINLDVIGFDVDLQKWVD